MFTKEMQAALRADAEKLEQLTGEIHEPVLIYNIPCEPGDHAYELYYTGALGPCVFCGEQPNEQ